MSTMSLFNFTIISSFSIITVVTLVSRCVISLSFASSLLSILLAFVLNCLFSICTLLNNSYILTKWSTLSLKDTSCYFCRASRINVSSVSNLLLTDSSPYILSCSTNDVCTSDILSCSILRIEFYDVIGGSNITEISSICLILNTMLSHSDTLASSFF